MTKELLPTAPTGTELEQILVEKNLSLPEILSDLSNILAGGENSSVKLRAAETALKLHGLLTNKGEEGGSVSVTINIQDAEFGSCNPILFPRQTRSSSMEVQQEEENSDAEYDLQ